MISHEPQKKVHHGRNIKRFREMFGMKQEALALELGEDWSQKKISRLEENETIDELILQEVSKALKLPVDAIKNFDEQAAVNYFNTFNDNTWSNNHGAFAATSCTFNPVDKLLEMVEEIKRLYEALLQSEREKVTLLEKVLGLKK